MASWIISPAATSIVSSDLPPVPSASVCLPPLASVPEASSPPAAPPRRESDHVTPSPQLPSPSATLPVTFTFPATGLRHATATPPAGEGCMLTLYGGGVGGVVWSGLSVFFEAE